MRAIHLFLDPDPRKRRSVARQAHGDAGLWALRAAICFDPDARVRGAAATRLGSFGDGRALGWLCFALGDRSPQVRARALRALARRGEGAAPAAASLRRDPCWWVRRAAALALAAIDGPGSIAPLRQSLDDPSWRVRMAVVRALSLLASEGHTDEITAPLPGAPLHAALALDHLRASLAGATPLATTAAAAPLPRPASPLDDGDPAVVAAFLARQPPGAIAPGKLVAWLTEPHAPLREQALRHLASGLDDEARREASLRLSDPRAPHAAEGLRRLGLGPPEPPAPRDPEALRTGDPGDPWNRLDALDLASAQRAIVDDPDPWVRRAAARLVERDLRDGPPRLAAARALAASPDPRLRIHAAALVEGAPPGGEAASIALDLHADPLDFVRAAAADALALASPSALEAVALDPAAPAPRRRAALTWLALRRGRADLARALRGDAALGGHAALLLEALGEGHGAEVTAPESPATAPAPGGARAALPEARPAALMPGRAAAPAAPAAPVERARIILSGRSEPSMKTLDEAREAGLSTFFWEPFYVHLTRHLQKRSDAAVIAGTYHADATSIERDVDRALRRLRRDALDVFLLFWARSPARLEGEPREALLRLKSLGKVRKIGFSTHLRGLAREAIERPGWDVLMTRHSAAHRGAEPLLAEAAARGVEALVFSSLCYGRLLRPAPGSATEPARAIDCYRLGLETPGVSALITAPRSASELRDAVEALRAPALDPAAREALLRHGVAVRAASQHDNGLLRQAPSDLRPGVRSLAIEHIEVAPLAPPAAPIEGVPREGDAALGWPLPSTRGR